MRKNIIPCTVGTKGPPPSTLRELGVERIIGRKIIRWSPSIGSYGMGGPGFMGACLSRTDEYPEEWLILMLWGATDWLLLDNVNIGIEAVNIQLRRQQMMENRALYFLRTLLASFVRSLMYIPGVGEWDKYSNNILGAKIITANITDNATCIILEKKNKKIKLEITVPPPWQWNNEESHLDAWAISDNVDIWC